MLDAIDLQLLQLLRENCRQSLRELGKKINLSAPAVNARLKHLEESGVIASFTLAVHPKIVGINLEALIFIDMMPYVYKRFLSFMQKQPAVCSCERITGEYCFMLRAGFKGVEQLLNFVELLEKDYGKCKVSMVLKREISERIALDADVIKD